MNIFFLKILLPMRSHSLYDRLYADLFVIEYIFESSLGIGNNKVDIKTKNKGDNVGNNLDDKIYKY